jgi:dCMP deaminase
MEVTWTKWEERFMERARHISSWSRDPKHCVGAVIMDPYHHLAGEGYNGPPMFTKDEGLTKEELRMRSLHAELNAILHANRFERGLLIGCTMFIYPHAPCAQCAAAIIQVQISEVVYFTRNEKLSHWNESQVVAEKMLGEAGIPLRYFI